MAPVPAPSAYGGRACYWTDLVVRADSPFETLQQTFGHRLALTTPESQSGFAAPLHELMTFGSGKPLFAEIIEAALHADGCDHLRHRGQGPTWRRSIPMPSRSSASTRRSSPDRSASWPAREPTAVPALVASSERGASEASATIVEAFLSLGIDPEARLLMDDLLLQRFAVPKVAEYDALRMRFETMQAFWRQHPIADKVHPGLRPGVCGSLNGSVER